jgi:hypothetical protein
VTIDAADRELAVLAERLARTHRDDEGWSAKVGSMRDNLMPVQLQIATMAMAGARRPAAPPASTRSSRSAAIDP